MSTAMKQLSTIFAFLFIFTIIGSVTAQQKIEELPIGSDLPMEDVEMLNIDEKRYSLNDFKQKNGLLVIFSCNTCPYVKAWEPRYLEVAKLADEAEVGMVLLNPNEARRNEDGSGSESLDENKKVAEKIGYTFPYLIDQDHKLADAFGATRTPHVYLFNSNDKLTYVGAIDDNSADASEVKYTWLKDAIRAVMNGEEIKTTTSKAFGCSIKRVD